VKDRDGNPHELRIGYIGFVPPQIMVWDKANLSGKVTVADITETAKKWVPELRKQGADVVIAIPHSGLSAEPYKAMAENSVYYLSQIPGIDAIMFGHAHAVFPSKDFAGIKGADIAKGTLNGVPAVRRPSRRGGPDTEQRRRPVESNRRQGGSPPYLRQSAEEIAGGGRCAVG